MLIQTTAKALREIRFAPCCAALALAAAGLHCRASDTAVSSTAPAKPVASATTQPRAKTLPAATTGTTDDALFDLARELYETYAPETIREHYEFMSRDQWNTFINQFEQSVATGSMQEIAALKPQASRALAVLRASPEYSEYSDWLAERLEMIEIAGEALQPSEKRPFFPARPLPHPTPARPPIAGPEAPFFQMPAAQPAAQHGEPFFRIPSPRQTEPVPYYDLWLKRVGRRQQPKNAATFVPLLKEIFVAERLPAELVWIAEVESSFNPQALSPAGARGLFQLMPATARSLGLRLFPFDERLNAGKSARAAARYLRHLHRRFGSWPLTLAAYNAGESRVAAALKKTPGAKDYDDICAKLPAETRLYVPKVLATLVVRGKVPLAKFIPPPPLPPLPALYFPPPA